ncbi:ABC transporter permease [Mesorhizobium sp. M7A.F.Ca.CA.001.07.2.1]|nr:ABC transporter permease [Mesorhizobium sp. M7A.F.Ca.MR.176.00.0.0]RUX72770.1 ABC transporter permease [Mesorhizobium sp. M7A.F.Ca.CA.004.08.2.1]RUX85226.1 ABC transporter permease [Mesorhizobium sp. M7A.F.Ca.CA.004.08.1.1]RUY28269.1 ABC transporter permease [Mesorhizobium sp. M7A.F.Ca.CA.004.12.1.1]RUY51291.1 ABC transporter permease [Mesorhizobium sp. M7A.F.Ca.CA.001.12.1.1]RUY85750.1 ABC transporter permease [Mesorhizobium sp. M7A.F.Ca.CA.001.10.2.1]RUZ56593.1 ABC transporter permease [
MQGSGSLAMARIRTMPATLIIGGAITLAWIVVAILAPVLTSFDPIKVDVMQALKPPGAEHWFGTDAIGRDVLARTLFAARYDLAMAFFGVVGPIILGTIIGLIAGYLGGRIDAALMRILEVTVSFPYFVLVIAIVAVLGPGLKSYFISLTLVNWVSYARLVRSQALVLRGVDFVLAARGMGFGHLRIMLFHILPNAIVPSIVFVMTDAVLAIVLGSSLGFLGLGVQPPTPEWGAMIADGQTYLTTAWWIAIFPGIAICLLALGLSLTADGLARLLNTES